MLFGRAPSAESLPGEVSQPQGPDLGAIVLALQAQVGEEVLALQVEIGGLREEVGGLRERVKFLENNVGSSGYQSTKAPTVFFDEIDGEAWPTSRPPVHKMAEPSGERGGEDGGLGHGSPGDLELKVDRVTDDREEGDRGGPEDGSGGGQPSPWLTEELEQSYELQVAGFRGGIRRPPVPIKAIATGDLLPLSRLVVCAASGRAAEEREMRVCSP
ncbi:hypothetical protein T484DRAFT_1799705 [Baffinella frigidus]|nr:hypothetical protein T484DRAFT_1799705 [Cryptophyta sp. CCMP2293]